MYSFKEFLEEEARWTKGTFYNIFLQEVIDQTGLILPLSPSVFEKTVGSVPIYAAHVLGYENVKNLLKIQNKKTKQLSAFTMENRGAKDALSRSGMWGGRGVVAIVKGYALASGPSDIMSVPDKNGIRYINIDPMDSLFGYFARKNKTNILEFGSELEDMKYEVYEKEAQNNEGIIDNFGEASIKQNRAEILKWINDNDNKAKQRMIKDFYDRLVPLMNKYKEKIQKVILSWAKEQSVETKQRSTTSFYDEVVLSNFKVLKLFVTDKETVDKLKKEVRGVPVVYTDLERISYDVDEEMAKLTRG